MATILSFRTALAAPRSHFSALASMVRLEERILRSTYFAETRVECGGERMTIYMPLSSLSLRRVERFLPCKKYLNDTIIPRLKILRDEMRFVDALGREATCDVLCEPLPKGEPFKDAVASIADDDEAAQLMDAVDELQARLLRAGVSHNNVREENIIVGDNYQLSLVRWYYATDGVGGDEEAFDALRQKIASQCESMTLHEADLSLYQASVALEGHLSVRFMHEGLAAVEHPTGWGFVDSDNRIVIEPKYEWVNDFREGRAEVQTVDGMGLIDKRGEYVIPPCYKIVEFDTESGYSQVLGDEGWMTFNYEGERLEELEDSVYPPPMKCEIY